MSLVDEMKKKRPGKNPVFSAVSLLETPDEIKQFYQDYIEYMIDEGYGKDVADHNIGYILGYYGDKDQELWYGTLNLGHPYFPNLRGSTQTVNRGES